MWQSALSKLVTQVLHDHCDDEQGAQKIMGKSMHQEMNPTISCRFQNSGSDFCIFKDGFF